MSGTQAPENQSTDDVTQTLADLEALRCRAVSELDLQTLRVILDERLKHTHLNGTTEGREAYFASITARPRITTAEPAEVTLLGDTAVMTGTLRNRGHAPDGTPISSQIRGLRVWHRSTGTGNWRLVAFAASGPLAGP